MKANWFLNRLLTSVLGLAVIAASFGPGPLGAVTASADGTPTAYVTAGRLNVRTGPGVGFAVVTRIDQWQTMTLLARNSAATWVNIRLPNGTEGWVNAYYIRASVPVVDLPVAGAAPSPAATGTVTVDQLELRAGPDSQYRLLTVLNRGQLMALLGRTTDTTWVNVSVTGKGEGWVVAKIMVRVVGAESGVASQTFQSSVSLGSLPVVSGPTIPQPSVSLSNSRVADASPVYIFVEGFPANQPVAAVLTSPLVPIGMVVASGQTDAFGAARLYFRMPDTWSSGAAMTENALSLAVGTTDGAVLVWNGIWCD
jgi:uncharacterized protein YgiM (DUF1202 family)